MILLGISDVQDICMYFVVSMTVIEVFLGQFPLVSLAFFLAQSQKQLL